VALYKRPDGAIFAIVSRKTGPAEDYLWQYQLKEESGRLTATLVRKFGRYSGKKEIEAIAVDDALGYVYYSDEQVGVRKYSADPDAGHNDELALFATEGFADDHEGISIYATSDTSGYVLVSDQGANKFHVFPRQGRADDPHRHPLLRTLHLSTISSDGSDVTSQAMGAQFPNGLFVAMSDDKTFQLYQWEQLAGEIIK
jgi:3-phytase